MPALKGRYISKPLLIAYKEEGVLLAFFAIRSGALNSPAAIQVNIKIMRVYAPSPLFPCPSIQIFERFSGEGTGHEISPSSKSLSRIFLLPLAQSLFDIRRWVSGG